MLPPRDAGCRSTTWRDILGDSGRDILILEFKFDNFLKSYNISNMQDRYANSKREYTGTHPWITFRVDLGELSHLDWMLLGEARAICDQIAGTPLTPEVADRLHELYLAKGVHATTAIEGNSLSEEEVSRLLAGALRLPPSQQYLAQEVENVIAACNSIAGQVIEHGSQPLSVADICRYNGQVLEGLNLREQEAVPGEIRRHNVVVGRYRAAPSQDCRYLLERMCDWLNGPDFAGDIEDASGFVKVAAKALAAHLYLAWIHPFGDGNGRTARLVEFRILVESGLPFPVGHLLSNHYNRTREMYYRALERSSKVEPYSIREFFSYALGGLVDGLQEQIEWIERQQLQLAWDSFVREQFADKNTNAARRQQRLLLDLDDETPTPRSGITVITPRIALEYAGKTSKTVTRDLNLLEEKRLIVRTPQGIVPNLDLVRAFLPAGADGAD